MHYFFEKIAVQTTVQTTVRHNYHSGGLWLFKVHSCCRDKGFGGCVIR